MKAISGVVSLAENGKNPVRGGGHSHFAMNSFNVLAA
jgi:hypothetical protein